MSSAAGAPHGPKTAELSSTVYDHLRAIAQGKLSNERPGHTLQATALVNEAYLRLDRAGQRPGELGPRFYWAAAEAMRRILIEHARARNAAKRGGNAGRVDWSEAIEGAADLGTETGVREFEALDRAILRLEEKDVRAGEVVRLKFFAGLGIDEVARALGISARTARREWEYARAWLLRELSEPQNEA